MSDFDAWMELADLYLQLQDYEKAAFCLEELIMSNPHNHLFHQRYAEVSVNFLCLRCIGMAFVFSAILQGGTTLTFLFFFLGSSSF